MSLNFSYGNKIESGVAYLIVNNDPALRQDIILEGTDFGYKEGQLNYVFSVAKLSPGSGDFYDLKSGDKYDFYCELSDEVGNMSNLSWSVDVTD